MCRGRMRVASMRCWLQALAVWMLWLPVWAWAETPALSDIKVEALVEALRIAAPPADPAAKLYSDWRVKPENIASWAKRCLGREVTPEQFAAIEAISRPTLICLLGPVLRDQFAQSKNNELVAVQRTAAWWLTGDAAQYRTGATGDYTLRVLEAYLRFF